MRHSFNQLIQTCRDACIDDTTATYTGLTDTTTFIKREINNTVGFIFNLMKEYRLQPGPRTASTVASQKYYSYPPDFSKMESLTITNGTNNTPLKIVQSQEEWDRLQQITISSGYATSIFPRQYDFGIYPTPSAAYTMTLNGNYNPLNMTASDYTTGTVTVTNNNATITVSGGTFTSAMVGRWFALTTSDGVVSGNLYKVLSYTSSTSMQLTIPISESSGSGLTYMIFESPEIPEELHEYIQYRVASNYYMLRRKDREQANALLNFFYTGDYINPKRRGNIKGGILATLKDLKERGRSNSQIVNMGPDRYETNYITNSLWGSTYTAP